MQNSYHPTLGTGHWQVGGSLPGVLPGAFTLPKFRETQNAAIVHTRELERTNFTVSSCYSRNFVVDKQCPQPERQAYTHPTSRRSDVIRCVRQRLGCPDRVRGSIGNMVPTPSSSPYQRQGDASCQTRPRRTSYPSHQQAYPYSGRQYDSNLLSKPHGRDSLSTAGYFNSGDMGVGYPERDSLVSCPPSWQIQHSGRLSEPVIGRSVGMETLPSSVCGYLYSKIPASGGPLCNPSQCTATAVRVMAPTPSCLGDERFLTEVDTSSSLRIPTVHPDKQGRSQDSVRESARSTDNAQLAHSSVVAQSTSSVSVSSNPPTSNKNAAHTSTNRSNSSNGRKTIPGRLGCLRRHYKAKGISKRSSEIMFASWRRGTATQYDAAWAKWSRWCDSRKSNPVSSPLKDILQFLTEQFDGGLSYSTMNSYRSAISSCHDLVDGLPAGQHPMILRLLKGMFYLKPPRPKYAVTWDVGKVISFLRDLPQVRLLSLKQLTLKLCMLISLTSADRGQSIALMDISNKAVTHGKATFFITGLTKCSAPGKSCKEIVLPAFEDRRLCVKSILLAYIERTQKLRGGHTRLFISYRRPFTPVTSTTLARWIRTVLHQAGITGYGAHSTRGASSSAALKAGLPVHVIMKAADWSKESTFTRFYRREVDSSQFGRILLQQAN